MNYNNHHEFLTFPVSEGFFELVVFRVSERTFCPDWADCKRSQAAGRLQPIRRKRFFQVGLSVPADSGGVLRARERSFALLRKWRREGDLN